MTTEVEHTEDEATDPVDDLSLISPEDLDAVDRAIAKELAVLKKTRSEVMQRHQAVIAERARRKALRLEKSYERARRSAVASGGPLPVPPPSMTKPAEATSAARRLGAMTITMSAGKAVPSPEPAPVFPEHRGAPLHAPAVSDHAIVRYLDRALDVDIDAVREMILSPVVRDAIRAGLSRIRTPEGVIVLRDGVVTSFLPSENGIAMGRPRKFYRGKRPDVWNAQTAKDLDLSSDD